MINQNVPAAAAEPASHDVAGQPAPLSGRKPAPAAGSAYWWVVAGLAILVLFAGSLATKWVVRQADAEQRAKLLAHANAIAHAINVDRVKALSFTAADLTVPEFQRLRSQMTACAQALDLQSLYMMALRDGQIVFGPESFTATNLESTPPGTVYKRAAPEDFAAFTNGQPVVFGPVTDEYGTFISALAPVLDPRTRKVLVVIGLDTEVKDWQAALAKARRVPIGFTVALLMVLLAGAGALEWRRRWPGAARGWRRQTEAILCAVVGLLLTAAGTWLAHEADNRSREQSFTAVAHAQADGVSQSLIHLRDRLELVGRLFRSEEQVARDEFRAFVRPLVRDGLAQVWAWVPVVTNTAVAPVEDQARQDGVTNFAVWEKDAAGRRQPVAGRAVYYPVLYVEPRAGNEALLGFDNGSEPVRGAALETAARTVLPTATAPIRLLQYTNSTPGLVVFHPVLTRTNNRRQLLGFATVVLRTDSLLSSLLARTGHREGDVSVELFQLAAGQPPQFLAASSTNEARLHAAGKGFGKMNTGRLGLTVPVFLFGQAFALVVHAERSYWIGYPMWGRWLVGGTGTLLTALLTGFFALQSRRRTRLEELVRERTVELQESEESYRRQFSENAAVMLLIAPEDGRILDANMAAARFYRYSPEKLRALRITDINLLPAPVVREKMASVTTERGSVFEFFHLLADGVVREVEECSSRIQFGGRAVLHSIITDITDRKVMQHRLRESEARQLAILTQITDVVAIMDGAGLITYKSPNLEKWFGWGPLDLLGTHCALTAHQDDRELLGQAFAKLLKSPGATVTLEYRYRCKDGSYRPVEATAVNLLEDTAIRGVLANYRDITRRRKAEGALRENERQLTALLGNLPGMAYRCRNDHDWTMVFASERCLELTGYTVEDLLTGRITYGELIHPDDRAGVWEKVQASLARREQYELRYRITTATGVEKWIWESGQGVFSEQGELEALEGINFDITQRQIAETALRDTLDRSRRQQSALAQIAVAPALVAGEVTTLAAQITELAAQVAGVERASVWLFNEAETELRCLDLYEVSPRRHSAGVVLHQAAYANEFAALRTAKYVDAHDPLTDPRTIGYRASYLEPLHITSMLDAAIRMGSQNLGLLCLEHVNQPHHWAADEIAFACQLGDQIAITLLNQRRRQDEMTLRESEVKHRILFLNSPDPYLILMGGVFVECNRATEVILRGDRSMIVGQSPAVLSPEVQLDGRTSAEVARERVQAAYQHGISTFEWVHRRFDGSGLTVEVTLAPMDWEGKPALFTAWRDITARKEAEEALRGSKARYDNLVAHIPVGVYTLRSTSAGAFWFEYVSPKVAEMLAVSAESILADAQTAFATIHPDDLPELVTMNRARFQSPRLFEWEGRAVINGAIKWLRLASVPEPLANGDILWSGVVSDITERKRAERALRESEIRFRTLVENIPQKIFIKDRNLRFVAANESFAQSLGCQADDLIGKSDYDFFPPELAARYRAEDERIILKGQAETLESQVLLGGREIWELVVKLPVRNEEGEITGVFGSFWDITERKQAEAALQQSQRLLAQTEKLGQVGGWEIDLVTQKLIWTETVFHLHEVELSRQPSVAEAIQFYAPASRPVIVQAVQRAIEQGEPFDVELEIITARGNRRCAHIIGEVDRARGKVFGFFQDITERKQAEEALREREAKYRLLYDNTLDTIWTTDMAFNMTYVNKAIEEFLGYTPEEFLGLNPVLWTQPESMDILRGAAERLVRKFCQGDVSQEVVEVKQVKKDGTVIDVEVTANLLRNAQGEVIGFSGRSIDITERKVAEAAIKEQGEQLKNLFDNAPVGIFHSTPKGRFLAVNPALARMLGHASPEELIAATADMTTQIYADPPRRSQIVHDLLSSDGWVHYDEVEWLRKDGQHIVVDMTGRRVLNAAGSLAYLEGFVEDVTERKQAERNLAAASNFHLQILKNAPALIWRAGTDALCGWFNDTWLEFTGRTLEQEKGNGWADGVHPDDFERCLKVYQEAFAARRSFSMDYRLRHHSGEYRWISDYGTPFNDLAGNFGGYIGYCFDITDRRQAAEALHASEERHRLLLQYLPVGVVVHQADTSIVLANATASRLLGLSLDQLQGRVAIDPAWHFLAEDGCPLPLNDYPVAKVLATGRPLENFLGGIYRPANHDRVWVLVNAFPQFDTAGKVRQVEVTFIDLTARKEAEETARQAQAKAQELLAISELTAAQLRKAQAETKESLAEVRFAQRSLLGAMEDTMITQKELAEAKAMLQTAMDCSPAGIAIADAPSGRLRYVNRAGLGIPGKSEAELVTGVDLDKYVASWHILDLNGQPLPPEEVPLAWAIQKGEPRSREFIIRRSASDDRTVLANAAPVLDSAGKVLAGIVVFMDITERKRAEAAQRMSEARFQEFMAHLPLAVFIRDVFGRTVFANRYFQSLPAWQGKSMSQLLDGKGAQRMTEDDLRALVGKPVTNQEKLSDGPGDERVFQTIKFAILVADQPAMLGGIALDITARQRAEEQARQQSEQLRLLYEASQSLNRTLNLQEIYQTISDCMSAIAPHDGLLISSFDAEAQLITCRAYATKVGWHDVSAYPPIPLEAEGKGTQSVVIRTGQAQLINDYQAQLKTARTSYNINDETNAIAKEAGPEEEVTRSALVVPLKTGNRVTGVLQLMSYRLNAYTAEQLQMLNALALHIASAEQNALLYAQVQAELHERQVAEEQVREFNRTLEHRVRERTSQLEASNRELEAFSYSVSHDLRAPLRAISGYARLLHRGHATQLDKEGIRVLGVVSSEAQRMGVLIDDLLAFSRLGRQPVERSTVNLEQLAKSVFAELAAAAPERDLHLTLSPLPPAQADAALLRQVLVNLLGNAIKYSRPVAAPRIELGSRVEGEETIYFVRDNGVGFDMKYVGKLFGVFQRLHTEAEFEGTGVGLALAQRIIHRHGGRIWADAKPGEGAIFSFTLPLVKVET